MELTIIGFRVAASETLFVLVLLSGRRGGRELMT